MVYGLSDCEVNLKLKRNQEHAEQQVIALHEVHDRHALQCRRHMENEIKQTRQSLKDISAKTQKTPIITVSENNVCSTTSDDDNDVGLTFNSHVRTHTQENIRACDRLSRSLGERDLKRERKRSLSPMRCGNLHSVSSKSIENLQEAARVLKNTEHSAEVEKLLTTLQSK